MKMYWRRINWIERRNEQIDVTKSGSIVEHKCEYLDPEQPQPGTSKT